MKSRNDTCSYAEHSNCLKGSVFEFQAVEDGWRPGATDRQRFARDQALQDLRVESVRTSRCDDITMREFIKRTTRQLSEDPRTIVTFIIEAAW